MRTRKPQPKIPLNCAVDMAIAAVMGDRHPLDMPVEGVDPNPVSLDLPETGRTCSRCKGPAIGQCPECGCAVCRDCLGLPD